MLIVTVPASTQKTTRTPPPSPLPRPSGPAIEDTRALVQLWRMCVNRRVCERRLKQGDNVVVRSVELRDQPRTCSEGPRPTRDTCFSTAGAPVSRSRTLYTLPKEPPPMRASTRTFPGSARGCMVGILGNSERGKLNVRKTGRRCTFGGDAADRRV
jgi:hypothetical protein